MSFIRLKILAMIGNSNPVNKMIAVKATSTWLEFKNQCAQKLGISGQSTTAENSNSYPLSFYWEGCEIEEEDNKLISEFAKEGDTFVVMQSLPLSQDATLEGSILAGILGEDLVGPSGKQETSGNRLRNDASSDVLLQGSQRHQPVDLTLAIFGSIDDRGLPSTSSQEKRCSCRNSKCIKLYCICFAGGNLCDGCMCRDCFNAPGNEALVMSERSKILARNPQAFSIKMEQLGEDMSHKTGCRCRKSRCVKKYCECFDGGVRCNPNCRCLECANTPDEPDLDEEPDEARYLEDHELEQAFISLDGLASLASAAQIASDCIDDAKPSPSLCMNERIGIASQHHEGIDHQRHSPPSDNQEGGNGTGSNGESHALASISSAPMVKAEAATNSSLLQNALQNHLMALIKGQGQGPPGSFLSIPTRQAESFSGHSSQQALRVPPSVQSASPLAPPGTAAAQEEGRVSATNIADLNVDAADQS